MVAFAAMTGHTRAGPAVSAEQGALSAQNRPMARERLSSVSGKLTGNLREISSKPSSIEKGMKCWDMWVTSATLLWGFSGEFEQALLAWPGQKGQKPEGRAGLGEDGFGRGPVPCVGGGAPGPPVWF